MKLFETDRLFARRLTMDDADAMAQIYGDVESMRYVGDARPLDADICRHWIDVTDKNFEKRGYGMLALIERPSGELIGCAGVVHPDQQEEPEVKYAFRRDKWGQGYATEAAIGLVGYARTILGKNRLISTVHPDHAKSQAVLAKAGFRHASDRQNEDGTVTQVWTIDWESSSV